MPKAEDSYAAVAAPVQPASSQAKKRNRRSRERLQARSDEEIAYPAEKRCSKCGLTKMASAFSKKKSEKSGLAANCKECTKIGRHDWYLRNRQHCIDQAAEYQAKHPEKAAVWQKAAQAKGRERYNKRALERYYANRSEIRATARERYQEDAAYRGKLRENALRYRRENPERCAEKQVQYRNRNRERLNVHSARYIAAKSAAGPLLTETQWDAILLYFDHRCAYCLRRENEVGRLETDHMRPLSRGGSNDADNIVPYCRSCNAAKSNRTPLEFLARSCDPSFPMLG